jgi:homoserine O-acetyltransferase
VIGGSMGAMQALEWLFLEAVLPVRSAIMIAGGAHHHAWQIALSEAQRAAIYADPKYLNGNYSQTHPPKDGLSVARQIAMISYRSHPEYERKFGRKLASTPKEADDKIHTTPTYAVETYLRHQGTKFLSRFDPNAYIKLTQLMDSHDVGRDRGGEGKALGSLHQPALIIGIDSDVLYPMSEQKELARQLANSELHLIRSDQGHDGFLLEQDQIGGLILSFLEVQRANSSRRGSKT